MAGWMRADNGKPLMPRWWIVSNSVGWLVLVAAALLAGFSVGFRWYTWMMLVGAAIMAGGMIYEIRRARLRGRRSGW